LTFKEVYIVKSAIDYLAENLYQGEKIFVDCFDLHSDFTALSTKKREVKGKCKYKRVAQEKKESKKIRSVCIICVLYTSIYVLLACPIVGNTPRPATLTSTLDTFQFCYLILILLILSTKFWHPSYTLSPEQNRFTL
jgi:hypothetical protein